MHVRSSTAAVAHGANQERIILYALDADSVMINNLIAIQTTYQSNLHSIKYFSHIKSVKIRNFDLFFYNDFDAFIFLMKRFNIKSYSFYFCFVLFIYVKFIFFKIIKHTVLLHD